MVTINYPKVKREEARVIIFGVNPRREESEKSAPKGTADGPEALEGAPEVDPPEKIV